MKNDIKRKSILLIAPIIGILLAKSLMASGPAEPAPEPRGWQPGDMIQLPSDRFIEVG